MNWLKRPDWPWWQAGAALGLLNALVFYTANYYLSASTTFSRASGMIARALAPEHVAANAYWQKVKPELDWQFMLVLGIPLGALLASRLGGTFRLTDAPGETFSARFGPRSAARWTVGLLGGVLVGFGARLADGCTSGHALSGGAQLALSSWLFFASFLASGTAAAWLIYGRK